MPDRMGTPRARKRTEHVGQSNKPTPIHTESTSRSLVASKLPCTTTTVLVHQILRPHARGFTHEVCTNMPEERILAPDSTFTRYTCRATNRNKHISKQSRAHTTIADMNEKQQTKEDQPLQQCFATNKNSTTATTTPPRAKQKKKEQPRPRQDKHR